MPQHIQADVHIGGALLRVDGGGEVGEILSGNFERFQGQRLPCGLTAQAAAPDHGDGAAIAQKSSITATAAAAAAANIGAAPASSLSSRLVAMACDGPIIPNNLQGQRPQSDRAAAKFSLEMKLLG